MMKNIDAGMGAVPMRKKKEVEVEKVEGEERNIFGRKTR